MRETISFGIFTDTHNVLPNLNTIIGDGLIGLGDYNNYNFANNILKKTIKYYDYDSHNQPFYLLLPGNHDNFTEPLSNLNKSSEYEIINLPQGHELRNTPKNCIFLNLFEDNIFLACSHEPPAYNQIKHLLEDILKINDGELIFLSGHTHKKTKVNKFKVKKTTVFDINFDSYTDKPFNQPPKIKGHKYFMKIDSNGKVELISYDLNNKFKYIIMGDEICL